MLDSKQLIEITGISRATLNNYVALGILPSPIVKNPGGPGRRTTRLGYFDEQAVATIRQVQDLKRQGLTMQQIAARIRDERGPARESLNTPGRRPALAAMSRVETAARRDKAARGAQLDSSRGMPATLSLETSIEAFPGPAYLVNNNLELIWWNDAAAGSLFGLADGLPAELEARNLLKLLLASPLADSEEQLTDLLRPALAAAKRRLSQQSLIRLYSSLETQELNLIKQIAEEIQPLDNQPMVHFSVRLPAAAGNLMAQTGFPANTELCDLYVSFFREGMLFAYSPVLLEADYLLEFLAQRDRVIHELLRKRKPHLTEVTVLVADVQNSTRLCAELPAEEYFELINEIWQKSEPIYRKYYGTYGKHAGDGMVYYFFPQPDCDHKLNAIHCALELRRMMQEITRHWQARKGWFSEVLLNIGLNEGREWFGSYHAGGHVEFTVLGETINHASRLSDFARNGSIWSTKSLLNRIPAEQRARIDFGITRQPQLGESLFVSNTYASLGSLLGPEQADHGKFQALGMLPVTEIRSSA